jgi:uncharacterized protein with FMN-binding domain
MRRVALAVISTITGLVFLLSFKTHSAVSTPTAAIGPATAGTGHNAGSTGAASSTGTTRSKAAGASSASSGTRSAAAKTFTGDVVETRYGPVQVRITVRNGSITAANAIQYPTSEPLDQEINAYAVPQLNQEVLSAQSAQIDMISGATYTSEGYLSSLQSALDRAGL